LKNHKPPYKDKTLTWQHPMLKRWTYILETL